MSDVCAALYAPLNKVSLQLEVALLSTTVPSLVKSYRQTLCCLRLPAIAYFRLSAPLTLAMLEPVTGLTANLLVCGSQECSC
jgi:hypothetical protein